MAAEGFVTRVAIAGVGGFAASHHRQVQALEEAGECRLVATCDPSKEALRGADEAFGFTERGVAAYASLGELLEHERLDVVTLPTPIPLHAEQHAAVIRAGAACYLEKPPSLWWPEYLEMVDRDADAVRPTNVGFNFVGDPMRRELRERLAAGEFGPVEGAALWAIWPRDAAYYGRNDWAGKRIAHGKPVMDSPLGNAMAHYVQNVLTWCGATEIAWVEPALFRVHAIENFDTGFIRAETTEGRWLRIGLTHVGGTEAGDREAIYCRGATITFDAWNRGIISFRDGRREEVRSSFADQGFLLRHNLRTFFAGEAITRLEDARAFVALNALANHAPIQTLTGEVTGLHEAVKTFAEHGRGPDFGANPERIDRERGRDTRRLKEY